MGRLTRRWQEYSRSAKTKNPASAGFFLEPSEIDMADLVLEAAIIVEPHVPYALRRALHYAGDDGCVASLPQLLHARVNASYDNII